MKRSALALFLCAGIYADTPPPAYDADLFRKDTRIFFFWNLEFLYWKANEGSLDYALRMKHPPADQTTMFASGKTEKAEFEWRPGFRIGGGYFNAPHYWDIYPQYTYYNGRGSNSTDAPESSKLFLNGTWAHPDISATPAPLAHAKTDVELNYHLFDLIVTRRFVPNPHLRLRVFGGITATWLRQQWDISYRDTNDAHSHIKNHWRFTGGGLRMGLTADWFLDFYDLYLTGTMSGALFAGSYHNVSSQRSTLFQHPIRNVHYHDTRMPSHWQFLLGPSWQKAIGSIRTEIFFGYELNLWSDLQEVHRSTTSTAQGPKETTVNSGYLGLQGYTLRWNLDF
ncbi:MAG: hypothetical protein JSR58_00590 [Verrucomicrobia bacterium]|nr:hypothetical protein [Verrucomicrobiota bacterium]